MTLSTMLISTYLVKAHENVFFCRNVFYLYLGKRQELNDALYGTTVATIVVYRRLTKLAQYLLSGNMNKSSLSSWCSFKNFIMTCGKKPKVCSLKRSLLYILQYDSK